MLVHVEGEAGLGKSRLLDELSRSLDGVRIGRASCSELERHLPYVPLAAALRRGVETGSSSMPSERRRSPRSSPSSRSTRLRAELRGGRGSRGARRRRRRPRADRSPARRSPLDGPQHARGTRLPAAPQRGSRRGHRDDGARPPSRRATTRSGASRPTRSSGSSRSRAAELAPLGMPDLHDATGGHPRVVVDAIANGAPACPSRTLTEALLAQCRAEGPGVSGPRRRPPCSSSRSNPSLSRTSSTPTPPSSRRSSSACASGGSSASTGSASASATTSSARSAGKHLARTADACCNSGCRPRPAIATSRTTGSQAG